MPQNEAAAVDQISGGTFSRLLFSDVEDEDSVTVVGLHHHHHHPDNTIAGGCASRFTFPADKKPPKMLCFGAIAQQDSTTDDNNNSSSPSCTTSSSSSNMKRNKGCDYYQPVVLPTTATPPVRTTGRNHKKMKAENTPPASHAKVKKEKLGERIAALQQMVSPYGKPAELNHFWLVWLTDTASVLHEAMGYIKFLQEQVQVLCSPYLQRLPPTQNAVDENVVRERKKDLRSRGLCLVPVECTLHVAESNGADLWSPAMVNRQASSSALR